MQDVIRMKQEHDRLAKNPASKIRTQCKKLELEEAIDKKYKELHNALSTLNEIRADLWGIERE